MGECRGTEQLIIMKKILSILVVTISIAGMQGCYYDKEELAYPSTACDTAAMTYTTNIQPIIQNFCYSCHAGAATGSFGINLDSYANLKVEANSGELVHRITSTDPAFMMPKGGPRLSDCDISKIQA